MATFSVLLVLLAATAVAAQDTLPSLPLFPALPASCGRITQVSPGDTCESLATYAGITMDQFKVLNPLVLCDSIGVQPGSAVCTGNNIAFCNDVYVAAAGETCTSISDSVATVINVDGTNSTTCSDLTSGVPVCVSPDPNACAVDTLCGVSIPQELQTTLTMLTDYCSIISECKNTISVADNALSMTISSTTPALEAAAQKDGHPEMAELVTALGSGPASLTVTITPEWYPDGSGVVATELSVPTSARRRSRRKLLTDGVKGNQTQVPRGNYGYGRR